MGAGSTRREPTVVGKPAEFMLASIAHSFGLERHQICMVGDRLDTDIQFGKDGGLSTLLVLSGMRQVHDHIPQPNALDQHRCTGEHLHEWQKLLQSEEPGDKNVCRHHKMVLLTSQNLLSGHAGGQGGT